LVTDGWLYCSALVGAPSKKMYWVSGLACRFRSRERSVRAGGADARQGVRGGASRGRPVGHDRPISARHGPGGDTCAVEPVSRGVPQTVAQAGKLEGRRLG